MVGGGIVYIEPPCLYIASSPYALRMPRVLLTFLGLSIIITETTKHRRMRSPKRSQAHQGKLELPLPVSPELPLSRLPPLPLVPLSPLPLPPLPLLPLPLAPLPALPLLPLLPAVTVGDGVGTAVINDVLTGITVDDGRGTGAGVTELPPTLVGRNVGIIDGTGVGAILSTRDATVGAIVGASVGGIVGAIIGAIVGANAGANVGAELVGNTTGEGACVGTEVGQ